MANKKFLWGMLATALIFAVVLTGCDNATNPSGSAGPRSVPYESDNSDGNTYRLTIIETQAASKAYTPVKGDTFVLELRLKNETVFKVLSRGTVESTPSGKLVLQPLVSGKSSEKTFSVTISSEGMTAISGDITAEDGSTISQPSGALTPKKDSTSTGGTLSGHYYSDNQETMDYHEVTTWSLFFSGKSAVVYGDGNPTPYQFSYTISGKTITLSAVEWDGSISSGTGLFPSATDRSKFTITADSTFEEGGEDMIGVWTKR